MRRWETAEAGPAPAREEEPAAESVPALERGPVRGKAVALVESEPGRSRNDGLFPGEQPQGASGKAIRVTFWVDAAGKVQKVDLDPEIRDRGYAKKFLEAMMNYEFRPARGPDGLPVAGKTEITITL